MNIIVLCGYALLAVVLLSILRQLKSEYAVVLGILFGVFLLKYAFNIFRENVKLYSFFFSNTYLGEWGNILLKTFGITLIAETTSDICRDIGETSIASKIEFIAKIEIMVISLPLIEKILSITKEIML